MASHQKPPAECTDALGPRENVDLATTRRMIDAYFKRKGGSLPSEIRVRRLSRKPNRTK